MEIKLIMISAAWIPFDRFWMDPPRTASLSEYLSPFVAALAAWQGRGYTTQSISRPIRSPASSVIEAGVYYNFMPLPVGWHLSSLSRKLHRPVQGPPREVR